MQKYLVLFCIILGSHQVMAAQPPVTVLERYSYPMHPGQDEGVAYVTLQNTSNNSLNLQELACDQGDVMIHETIIQNGRALMIMRSEVTIPAHGRLTMKPGGQHIMIDEPKKPVKIGDQLIITFNFKGYDPLVVTVPVVQRAIQ